MGFRFRSMSLTIASRAKLDSNHRDVWVARVQLPLTRRCRFPAARRATRRAALKLFDTGPADLWRLRGRESVAGAPAFGPAALQLTVLADRKSRRGEHRSLSCRERARCPSASRKAARRWKKYLRAHQPYHHVP